MSLVVCPAWRASRRGNLATRMAGLDAMSDSGRGFAIQVAGDRLLDDLLHGLPGLDGVPLEAFAEFGVHAHREHRDRVDVRLRASLVGCHATSPQHRSP